MAIFWGYFIGATAPWVTTLSNFSGPACLVGVILALVALFLPSQTENGATVERIAAGGLLVYVALAAVSEQFAWVGTDRDILFCIAWLFPLAVGGAVLPLRGYWLVGVAFWAVLFASISALTYSACHDTSGVGLFLVWMS
jgi:hypothetical protein